MTTVYKYDLLKHAAERDFDKVRSLLWWGVDPNARVFTDLTPSFDLDDPDTNPKNPFFVWPDISDSPGTPLTYAARYERSYAAKILLEYGADPNMSGGKGMTALHYAVQRRNLGLVELLLESGANPNLKRDDSLTAIHLAVDGSQEDIASTLIRAGAKLNIYTGAPLSNPLSFASLKGDTRMAGLLLSAGAKPQMILKPSPATPFGSAYSRGNPTIVCMMLIHGADPTLSTGKTPPKTPLETVQWNLENYSQVHESAEGWGHLFGSDYLPSRLQLMKIERILKEAVSIYQDEREPSKKVIKKRLRSVCPEDSFKEYGESLKAQ